MRKEQEIRDLRKCTAGIRGIKVSEITSHAEGISMRFHHTEQAQLDLFYDFKNHPSALLG